MQDLNIFPQRRIYTVSELASEARVALESAFFDVWVQGEISNFRRPQSGHFYFTLKDRGAQIKAVCFRTANRFLKFRVQDGLSVLVRGRVSLYEARGDFQLVADYMEPAGAGTLQFMFEQLKSRLHAEGLFDTARKRPLPRYPRKVGVVTSPTGAAIHDILRVLKRRNQRIDVLIYPVRVQGEGAAEEVVQGIRSLNARGDIDVLIVARGGGSAEDLAAFNDEGLARAICQSLVPVVSAVGHEIDFTICDFVADLRAPTPSAAAEIVSQTQEQMQEHVAGLLRQAGRALGLKVERCRRVLERAAPGVALASLRGRLQLDAQRLDDLAHRMELGARRGFSGARGRLEQTRRRLRAADFDRRLAQARETLLVGSRLLEGAGVRAVEARRHVYERLAGSLHAYSPLAALQRGYAILRKGNRQIVKSVRDVHVGEEVRVHLHQGELTCRVQGLKS